MYWWRSVELWFERPCRRIQVQVVIQTEEQYFLVLEVYPWARFYPKCEPEPETDAPDWVLVDGSRERAARKTLDVAGRQQTVPGYVLDILGAEDSGHDRVALWAKPGTQFLGTRRSHGHRAPKRLWAQTQGMPSRPRPRLFRSHRKMRTETLVAIQRRIQTFCTRRRLWTKRHFGNPRSPRHRRAQQVIPDLVDWY